MNVKRILMRIFGMEIMRFIGILLTIIAIAWVGYSLHTCQCDQKIQFLGKEDFNVSYTGNDTIIIVKNRHIEVVADDYQNNTGMNVAGRN
jgi:hypothetical protein